MTDNEIKEFDSADRMTEFKMRHPDVFKGNARIMSGFDSLEADITLLENQGAIRITSKGLRSDGTQDKSAAKSALYKLVRKAVDTGKLIKKEEPEFDNQFKIRRGTMSNPELLDAARGFAVLLTTETAKKMSEFGASSVNADNFKDKIKTFEAGRAQQDAGRGAGVAATAEIKAVMKRLRSTRRTVAKIGTNIIEDTDDAGLLGEWQSASKIEKSGKSAPNTSKKP